MSDFSLVQSLFSQLLSRLRDVFSASEIAEVADFVDASEYGLALETAVDIFSEERKIASDDLIALARDIATAMGLPADEFAERLRSAGKG